MNHKTYIPNLGLSGTLTFLFENIFSKIIRIKERRKARQLQRIADRNDNAFYMY